MKNMNIHFKSIVIDKEEINIPVAILNKTKRKTILITAGIDGDEYAGIKAAYKIIDNFEKLNSKYRIIVIPLVNIFGNKEGVSHNPKDGKYPKYIYPGKINGSSSEQLIFYLNPFIKESFLWIDLHSGASDEKLKPFIWVWETKKKAVNDLALSIVSDFQNDNIIYQKVSVKKVEELAKENITYIMLESGELGKENKESIEKHMEWIEKIITGGWVRKKFSVYRKVKFYTAPKNGIWKPDLLPGTIKRETVAGFIDDKKINSDEGLLLYIKKRIFVKKGTELLATASNLEII